MFALSLHQSYRKQLLHLYNVQRNFPWPPKSPLARHLNISAGEGEAQIKKNCQLFQRKTGPCWGRWLPAINQRGTCMRAAVLQHWPRLSSGYNCAVASKQWTTVVNTAVEPRIRFTATVLEGLDCTPSAFLCSHSPHHNLLSLKCCPRLRFALLSMTSAFSFNHLPSPLIWQLMCLKMKHKMKSETPITLHLSQALESLPFSLSLCLWH